MRPQAQAKPVASAGAKALLKGLLVKGKAQRQVRRAARRRGGRYWWGNPTLWLRTTLLPS
jgi:hypothetical protein